ncbi:MAG: threonine aldolase family protein [Senegalia sp. (in: firmicutes)]|uniref:threonine aldolase family protein n=1 Tax=Senegalia sp. (in: firmicutes) TaxID=1924098 RepID=UPI003F9A41C4
MYSFMNDYSEGAHEKILESLIKYNLEQNVGYGEDKHSEKAKEYIKGHMENQDVDIHFIPGGTQTNLISISSFLRPHEAVIAAHTGHINVHETGAIEATGHKVIAMDSKDGKLSIESIKKALNIHSDEHMVKPKMVYISNTTELGTIYTKNELKEIHNICKENNLILFLDGARLGSALTSKGNDLSLKEIANLVDVFYIGGTKNGALLGEALVITNDKLKEDFRYLIKQKGALMAKGFIAGIQFETLFEDDLFFTLAKHANQMAEKIVDELENLGYKFYAPSMTNQIFPILSDHILDDLSKEFLYSIEAKVDENNSAVRFVTSWATTEESVSKLISFFENIK